MPSSIETRGAFAIDLVGWFPKCGHRFAGVRSRSAAVDLRMRATDMRAAAWAAVPSPSGRPRRKTARSSGYDAYRQTLTVRFPSQRP
jgi:hypothetical protein